MTGLRGVNISIGLWFDIFLRIFLAILFVMLEKAEPFVRKIHDDEVWLYRNPKTDSYVPTTFLWPLVFITPFVVITLSFLRSGDKVDLHQGSLAVSLALGFNGVITDMIKLIVGRPRPDFFWRCFPNGEGNSDFLCTGNPAEIRDGRKSFPSGHSSFAFASLGFIALYLAGKFKTFGSTGKSHSWKLCAFILPLAFALAIALSRTCDYHHHWQDVAVGSFLGLLITYLCYRHYYPPLDCHMCHRPYSILLSQGEPEVTRQKREEDVKWI
ncbi:phospholipid phosphatase 5 isoform X1 [Diachasma alloeum]|uniref:phospholipid phosphatase 5 isoform X1 n=1 Tax=Diachasma alloeum TaxID=454923 RepID=UPI0007381927|nr:phospholipid phosphatase 5 isoform X1 [Diachasma alloeum]